MHVHLFATTILLPESFANIADCDQDEDEGIDQGGSEEGDADGSPRDEDLTLCAQLVNQASDQLTGIRCQDLTGADKALNEVHGLSCDLRALLTLAMAGAGAAIVEEPLFLLVARRAAALAAASVVGGGVDPNSNGLVDDTGLEGARSADVDSDDYIDDEDDGNDAGRPRRRKGALPIRIPGAMIPGLASPAGGKLRIRSIRLLAQRDRPVTETVRQLLLVHRELTNKVTAQSPWPPAVAHDGEGGEVEGEGEVGEVEGGGGENSHVDSGGGVNKKAAAAAARAAAAMGFIFSGATTLDEAMELIEGAVDASELKLGDDLTLAVDMDAGSYFHPNTGEVRTFNLLVLVCLQVCCLLIVALTCQRISAWELRV
mmetsp:Transcript_64407/g.172375  ORF Transcript_64407/g.172375 Transcript_64407/m.172375 type:complete len:372 (+) Transcript_64407:415-1530(+)